MNPQAVVRICIGILLLLPVLGLVVGSDLHLPWPVGWMVFVSLTVSPALAVALLQQRRAASLVRAVGLHVVSAAAVGALACYGLRKAGLAPEHTVSALAGLCLALGVVALLRLRWIEPRGDRADRVFIILAVLLLASTWFATHASYRHLLGAHGMWHTACGMKALEQVPPENPVFAGRPLYMYWGFNLYVAQLSLAVGHSFGEVAFGLNVLALVALLAASWTLSGCFFTSHRWRWFATALLVGGLNALGSGWLLLRLVTGQNPWHEYLGPLRLNELALKYDWYQCSLALGHFYHPGGAALGLALFVAIVYLVARALQQGPVAGSGVPMFTWLAGATMLHPVSGGVGFMVVMAGLVAALLRPGSAAAARRGAVALAVPGAAGMLVMVPHMLEVSGAIEQELSTVVLSQPRLLAQHLWDWAGPWLWALPLLPWAVVAGLRRKDAGGLMVVGATVMLIVAAISVRLAYDNQYKFVYLQAPFIAIMAAWVLGRISRPKLRRLLVGGLLSATVATAMLGTVMMRISDRYEGFFHYQPEGRDVVMDAVAALAGAAMHEYLRHHTPANAVIIESPVGLQHNTTLLETSVVGRRTGFTGLCSYWMSGGYPDCPARQRIAEQLHRAQPLSADQWALLRALCRPLYLLVRPDVPDAQAPRAYEQDDRLQQVFAVGDMRLYRITP